MRDEVRQAAARLDARYPGWASRIDVGLLDMESCTRCIIGQARRGCDWGTEAIALMGLEAFHSRRLETHIYSSNRYHDDWIEAVAERVCPVPEGARADVQAWVSA